jgi:hypothetical protein
LRFAYGNTYVSAIAAQAVAAVEMKLIAWLARELRHRCQYVEDPEMAVLGASLGVDFMEVNAYSAAFVVGVPIRPAASAPSSYN